MFLYDIPRQVLFESHPLTQFASIGDNRQFNVDTLHKLTKNIKPTPLDIESIDWRGTGTGSQITKTKSFKDKIKRDKDRINKANLDYPILTYTTKDNKTYILDGTHRVLKAILKGKQVISHIAVNDDILRKAQV